MRTARNATAFLMAMTLALVAGCSLLSPPRPETIPEALALNYATIESLSNSVAASYTAGSINVEKARNVRDILEEAYRINKMAEAAYNAGAATDAGSYLQMTSALLTQVEAML